MSLAEKLPEFFKSRRAGRDIAASSLERRGFVHMDQLGAPTIFYNGKFNGSKYINPLMLNVHSERRAAHNPIAIMKESCIFIHF